MFIGHFALGFAAKPLVQRVSLGTLFLAAQFIDVLWPSFLLLGLEEVRIAPGATAVTPLVFVHYPYSHSLLAVLLWASGFALCYQLLRRYPRGALVLGALVVSHWFLDLIVHQPDLPLYPGGTHLLGLGLWNSPSGTVLLELALFVVGVALYLRATAARDGIGQWALVGLIVTLLVIQAGNLFGEPPLSVTAIAWVGQAQWLLVLWGYWVDRHRRSRELPFPENQNNGNRAPTNE